LVNAIAAVGSACAVVLSVFEVTPTPEAVAVLTTDPASRSAWVTVRCAVHVTD
jgi:hypothetical protein